MTMRAAILEAIGRPLVIEEVELRAPGAHEVVVRIAAIDVCITDALSARGDVAAAPPTILGHAAAGIVEEVGAHVERVRAGDRVVVAGTPECGECFWCIRDQPDQCAEMLGGILPPRVVATRAGGEPVHADGGVGAFAERMVLRDSGVVAVDTDALRRAPVAAGLRGHRGRGRGPQPRRGPGRLVGGGRRLRRAGPVDDPGGAGGGRDDDRRRGAARRAP